MEYFLEKNIPTPKRKEKIMQNKKNIEIFKSLGDFMMDWPFLPLVLVHPH